MIPQFDIAGLIQVQLLIIGVGVVTALGIWIFYVVLGRRDR